jgi:hypothetical protein
MQFACIRTSSRGLYLGLIFLSLVLQPAWGGETRLAIRGYDPVAYFTDGAPVPGKSEFEHEWQRSRWRFASAAHRDLFTADPDRYAPQYDGYCAMGVAQGQGHKSEVDPEAWAIVDGKLYLTFDRFWLGKWREDISANIKQANENWPTVKEQPE